MNCIKCNKPLPEGALFCPICGKKQVQEKRKTLKRPNGSGTVYKLSGRRKRPWVAAKARTIIGYYEKRSEAVETLERLAGVDVTERYNMTFAEVFKEWSAEHYKTIGEKSKASYDRSYDVFNPLHDSQFRKLRTRDYQDITDKHNDKSYSTRAKLKNLLMQMYAWAMREEICTTNFAEFVNIGGKTKTEKPIFTQEEIKKIEADQAESAKIVVMLLSTGMRIGELFGALLKNYHGTYVIGGEKTEAGKNRVIPIRAEGREAFKYFADKAKGDLLLSGHDGQHDADNFRKREYYPLLERLGIDRKPPHTTRHTYASRAVKEGLAPELLQKILGHTDYAVTANIYTHIDTDTLVKAVDVTNTLLTNTDSQQK